MTKDYKILCVDDESNVLQGIKRQLRKQFHIDVAEGGQKGLETIAESGPYAVVVSDMRMPGMDGAEFLAKVKQCAPQTVRMMLTGNSDQQTAIEAVNKGSIFRFLNKPCSAQDLAAAISDGIEQYRLITVEKEVLEQTLGGSIKILSNVLSLASPEAFGRATRIRPIVKKLCQYLHLQRSWEVDLAAMLSQIGWITLPDDVVEKLSENQPLTKDEDDMVRDHPKVGSDLVANIPRLERVAQCIAHQNLPYTGNPSSQAPQGKDIPIGARILKVTIEYDRLISIDHSPIQAVAQMREKADIYDPEILSALGKVVVDETKNHYELKELPVSSLISGMILAQDVRNSKGMLMVGKGQEITPSLSQRLKNYARMSQIKDQIRVLIRIEQL